MRFRHSCAVKTLKGKSGWWFRKCRFSITKTSAPTHSVYAAIKASAILNPLISYFYSKLKRDKKIFINCCECINKIYELAEVFRRQTAFYFLKYCVEYGRYANVLFQSAFPATLMCICFCRAKGKYVFI